VQQFKFNSTGHRIPVKVSRKPDAGAYPSAQPVDAVGQPLPKKPTDNTPAASAAASTESNAPSAPAAAPRSTETQPDWEAIARQMQADMENFRKRQQRRANDAIAGEKERLLRQFLPLADNLQRALSQNTDNVEALREGIELTLRQLEQTLTAEGVTRMETVGRPFDPAWHEAVATIPADTAPDTVVDEVEAGYKIDQKLLRPAKLIVAA
jgi:molecular chaperone GrpE